MSRGVKVVIGNQLAEGGFSFVYFAFVGNKKFALKKILCQTLEQLKQAEWEIEVHKALKMHSSMLRLVDHVSIKTAIGTEVYLLYPLYENGTLRDFIDRNIQHSLREQEILKIFVDICTGVSHLHNHKPSWAHRDIKPENILLDDNNNPVLMDFGSVAPAQVQVTTRSEALLLQEDAAQHCSMPYRAPGKSARRHVII
jgi:serine/threonine kinase 16